MIAESLKRSKLQRIDSECGFLYPIAMKGDDSDPSAQSKAGLMKKIADLFMGTVDPQKEKKRLLKSVSRTLRKIGAKYYNTKTEKVEPGLAKVFYHALLLVNVPHPRRKVPHLPGIVESRTVIRVYGG